MTYDCRVFKNNSIFVLTLVQARSKGKSPTYFHNNDTPLKLRKPASMRFDEMFDITAVGVYLYVFE